MAENNIILLALRVALKRAIAASLCAKECTTSWSKFELDISEDLHVNKIHIQKLHTFFFEDGEVVSLETKKRGPKLGQDIGNTKVTAVVLNTFISFINEHHAKKMPVICSQIMAKIINKHGLVLDCQQLGEK